MYQNRGVSALVILAASQHNCWQAPKSGTVEDTGLDLVLLRKHFCTEVFIVVNTINWWIYKKEKKKMRT